MRRWNVILAVSLIIGGVSGTCHAGAAEKPIPQNSVDQPSAASKKSCLDGSRLLSHAAYRPTEAVRPQRCSHLLSTDTLLSTHRWDRT